MFKRIHNWLETSFTSAQFSYKQLRSMYGTLILDQCFIMIIGMLSTAMVSSTGEAAIAAANMVGSINTLVVVLFTAVATGGSVVIARAKGSGDDHSIRCAMGQSICMAGIIGTVLGLFLVFFSEQLVGLIYPHADPLLIDYSIRYMKLCGLSFLPYSIFNAIFHAFRSLGDTKSSLLLTVVVNVTHLLCSFVFINIMDLGIDGAGLSFIVARLIGAVLALTWLLAIHNEHHIRVKHLFHFSKRISREVTKLAIPLASESAILQGGMLLVQVYLAFLSTTELAAHGVANSYMQMYYITGYALTTMVSTVTGQCFGAGLYDDVRRYTLKFIRLARFIMLGTVLILTPLSPIILQIYHPSEQAMPIIMQCLMILSVIMPTLFGESTLIPMTLRAAGDVLYPTVVSIVTLFTCRIALGYFLTIVCKLGVPGVWLSLAVEWVVRAIALKLRFNGKKWLKLPQDTAAM